MSRGSIALLAFGLGIVATPVITVVISHSTTTAMAQERDDDLVHISPVDEERDAKQVYLDLVKSKLSLMTPEELQQETEALRGQLFEMQATEKLREAQRKLEELINEHPQTTAAQRARNMLKNADQIGPGQRSRQNPSRLTPTQSDPFSIDSSVPDPSDGEVVAPRRERDSFDAPTPRRRIDNRSVPVRDDDDELQR